jgi:predicted O-methyltransferase YrrM
MIQTMNFTPSAPQIERLLRSSTAADAATLARQYLEDHRPWTAIAVCEAAFRLGLVDPALTLCLADAHFRSGRAPEALAVVNDLLGDVPDHLPAQSLQARLLAALGSPTAARDILLRVVARYPDYPGALAALSSLMFPGPSYREVIDRLHRLVRPATYLEIGVETGATLALAAAARVPVGIDPHPEKMVITTSPNTRLYPMTSDAFFERETAGTVFHGQPVDLAFIDGMHWFEYVLRDFANVESWCTPASTILLHDCLPVTGVAARRERESSFWVGDTWKALECLLEYRPDLHIRVIPTGPSGLVVVRHLDPGSTVLADRMEEILTRYRDCAYPNEPGAWPESYPMVANDDEGLRQAVAQETSRNPQDTIFEPNPQ